MLSPFEVSLGELKFQQKLYIFILFVKYKLHKNIVCNAKGCYIIDMTRKTHILNAAATVFFERGVRKAKFGDIAKEAGISRPTLYAAFEDKNAIMVATIHYVSEQFLATIKEQIADRVTAKDRLTLFTNIAIIEPYKLIQQSEDAADILSGHNDAGRKAMRETLESKSIFLKEILTPFFSDTDKDHDILERCRTFVLASSGLKNTVANADELQRRVNVLSSLFLQYLKG